MSTRSAGWHRADPMERLFIGCPYSYLHLGLDVPTVDQVRAALVTIARRDPFFARWFGPGWTWRHVAPSEMTEWLELTVAASDLAGPSAAQAMALTRPKDDRLGFRFTVGPDWIGMRMEHAVGDGQAAHLFLSHVQEQAFASDELPFPWRRPSRARRNYEIARNVLRGSRNAPYVWRHRREFAGADRVVLPEHSDFTTVQSAAPADFLLELRELRQELYPGASTATLLYAGLRDSIARHVGDPAPGFAATLNARSTSPSELPAWGNWSVVAFLYPERDDDADAIGDVMRSARERSVPEFALAAKRAAASRPPAVDVRMASTGVPRLLANHIPERFGHKPPGLRPGVTGFYTEAEPNGLDGVQLQTNEFDGRLLLSIGHYPQSWPSSLIERCVDDFLTEGPARLRERARGGRG